MNTKSGSSIVALFALLVCIAVPEASNAEGYPRADAQAAKSLTHAMGVPILSTLRRQPASLASARGQQLERGGVQERVHNPSA